jgi:hypothetical protein
VVAGADRLARAHLDAGGCPYYGRVVREGGDTVCQYWFVCPFKRLALDLPRRQRPRGRLGTVAVFLVADHGRLRAAWAASSHDHDGEALRRRWDDPGIRRAGDHPVVSRPGSDGGSQST